MHRQETAREVFERLQKEREQTSPMSSPPTMDALLLCELILSLNRISNNLEYIEERIMHLVQK